MADGNGTALPFKGKRILVVEDEVIVAMLIEDILADLGATVAGPVSRNAQALELLGREAVDAAILDVNLGGETSDPTARALRALDIPFAFATGYGAAGVPPEFEGQATLPKPFREAELRDALLRLLGQRSPEPQPGSGSQ